MLIAAVSYQNVIDHSQLKAAIDNGDYLLIKTSRVLIVNLVTRFEAGPYAGAYPLFFWW